MKNKSIRFNIIDFVIIIAVLAIVAAVVVRQFIIPSAFETKLGSESTVTMLVQVRVQNIQEQSKDYFHVGDVVKNSKGIVYATINDVVIKPAVSHYIMETGEIKELEIPKRVDAYLTLKCEGKSNSKGYFLKDSTNVAITQQIAMNTPYIAVSGTITSFEVEPSEATKDGASE